MAFVTKSLGDVDFGSKTDLWDGSQGAVVTRISGRANDSFKPENMFGASFPTTDADQPTFVFEDGKPAGYVHFVEWKTATPVTVKSFRLHAQGDGPEYLNGRDFTSFRLLAKTPGSSTFDHVLYQFSPSHPYEFEAFDSRLVISQNVELGLAQEFRAEFVDSGVRFWSAPRIFELDGFDVVLDPGSKMDLWDTSQGSVVTRISGQANDSFKPENMFGGSFPTTDANQPTFVFEDGKPAGYVHFIEWKTAAPVKVKSFKLHAQGDGPEYLNGREFSSFRLLAKTPGSNTFDHVLYQFSPSHPYVFEDADSSLVISDTVTSGLAQEFRAEFVDSGVRFWSAPRIFELDGFAESNQPNLKVFTALELVWKTTLGHKYQLQWREGLVNVEWKDYGDSFIGDGSGKSLLISARETGVTRIFRLVELQ